MLSETKKEINCLIAELPTRVAIPTCAIKSWLLVYLEVQPHAATVLYDSNYYYE